MNFSVKFLILLFVFSFTPTTARAKSQLVQKLSDVHLIDPTNCTFTVELHYDKEKKKVDLWFDYHDDDKRNVFKATSITERLKDATHKLVPQPVSKLNGRAVLIFNGFENNEKGYFDGDRGLALLIHHPVDDLSQEVFDTLYKKYPNAFINDAAGQPKFVKAILSRITLSQVYPIAAFDSELDL